VYYFKIDFSIKTHVFYQFLSLIPLNLVDCLSEKHPEFSAMVDNLPSLIHFSTLDILFLLTTKKPPFRQSILSKGVKHRNFVLELNSFYKRRDFVSNLQH
jgi:hypothetical protein